MRKFLLGVAVGFFLGAAGTAFAVNIVGDAGHLLGWDVTIGGVTVCSDPLVWPKAKEIECE